MPAEKYQQKQWVINFPVSLTVVVTRHFPKFIVNDLFLNEFFVSSRRRCAGGALRVGGCHELATAVRKSTHCCASLPPVRQAATLVGADPGMAYAGDLHCNKRSTGGVPWVCCYSC
ncbi:MAG: hypothetical protein EHM16_06560 [Betaproteobacteria bacterium]|nr:MAG: hypothetical protein EHM16_06560 [Betaproteobacteria bacterium]